MGRSAVALPPVFLLAAAVWVSDAAAQSSAGGRALLSPDAYRASLADTPLVRAAPPRGRIEGVVTDDQGTPLRGVAITAVRTQLVFAVTDSEGRFAFEALPAGLYFLSAHLPGFVASRRELVEVQAARATNRTFLLARTGEAGRPRPILEASIAGVAAQENPSPSPSEADAEHSHSATAWRLRHLRRSVLKEINNTAAGGECSEAQRASLEPMQALSLLAEAPFSAQVQFLTISAFDKPEEIFGVGRLPHSVAYVALSAPVGDDATWSVQGAITQGDISSWVFGGNYASTIAGRHHTDVGMTYAAQRYDGGNPVALSAMGDTSRTVGAIHASDQWVLSPTVDITAGAGFAHYGYVESAGLLSPSIEARWEASPGTTLHAVASRRMLVPGAEEFVPSPVAGVWMPPQRTFSAIDPEDGFLPERTRHLEVGFEREIASLVLASHVFRQFVDGQIVTIFGLQAPGAPRTDLGHYFTASAGNVETVGWSVAVSRPVGSRVRGSMAFKLAHANWQPSPYMPVLTAIAQSAARQTSERIYDLTTTVEAGIPETATRLYAVYKLNSAYSRDDYSGEDSLETAPGLGGRFDVQVNQRLPFLPVGSVEWEILVAVRNLFRDHLDRSSLYDELLVVRPPKRIVGGLMIRF